jgi:hypothetical protein
LWQNFAFRSSLVLDKANVGGTLAEATTAQHEAVLANQTLVGTTHTAATTREEHTRKKKKSQKKKKRIFRDVVSVVPRATQLKRKNDSNRTTSGCPCPFHASWSDQRLL